MRRKIKILSSTLFLLLCLSLLRSEENCEHYSVKRDCNEQIFVSISGQSSISIKKYNEWINNTKNKSILSNYFTGVSTSRTSVDGLIQEARNSLASQISVNISSNLTSLITSEISSEGEKNDRLITSNMEQFVSQTISDYETITVKDNDIYTVFVFKCKTAYFEQECRNNNRLSKYIDNEIHVAINIIKNKNNTKVKPENRLAKLFSILAKTYLYTYSSSNIELIDKNKEIKSLIIDKVLDPMEKILHIKNNSINRIPYIHYNSAINVIANAAILGFDDSYIENFPLYAIHNNGISSWKNNILPLDEISNGKTSFVTGMLMSQSSLQNISIHPYYMEDVEELKKGNFVITDAAIASLTNIIEKNPLTIIDIVANNQLPLKISFDQSINDNIQSEILNDISKIKNISNYFCMCEGSKNQCETSIKTECFEMNFNNDSNSKNGNIIFSTPDKKQSKTKSIKIKSNGISSIEKVMKNLYSEIFKSNIKYNFCDKMTLYINGDKVYNEDLYKTVPNGPIDISIDYSYNGKNVNIYKNQLIIYNDKDLNDLVNETDLFEFKEQEVCYQSRNIDYKIVLTNDDISLKNLIIEWNDKKYKYDNSKREFQNKNKLFGNPLLINENSLKTNKIKISKNGYNTYKNNNITATFNYRGEYPFIRELEKNPNFNNPFHYFLNIMIPGKGQSQYYSNSLLSKIRGLLTGIGAYYFAYEALGHYQDYENYNKEFYNYSNLYNSTFDQNEMNLYKNKVLENQELSNDAQNKTLQFGILSGILFSGNFIEITIIHLDF